MQFLRIHKSLTLLLLVVSCAFLGCSQEAKRARHLKRAEDYFAKGEYIKAEIEYRNVVRLSKQVDPLVVARLAHMYYDQGRIFESFSLVTNAVALNPTDMDLRYRLGTIYVTFRQFSNAQHHALVVLTNKPDHAEALLLLADAARSPEEIQAARRKIDEVARKTGDRWSVHVALAELAFRDKQTNAAQDEIQKAAQLDAKNPHVIIALAKLAASRNAPAEVEGHLKTAAENSPRRSPNRLVLPQYHMDRTNLAAAKTLLDQLMKDAPDYVPAASLRGRIAIREKDFETSSKIAKEVLSWNPYSYDIRLLNARTLTLQGDTNSLIEFERLLSLYPQVPELHYESAVANVQSGNIEVAMQRLNEAVRLQRDYVEAVILRAELNLRTGSADEAVLDLFTFTQRHPNNARAFLVLANAYRFRDQLDEALNIYRAFIRQYPNAAEFHFSAGSILLQQKKYNEARPYFEQALRILPGYVLAAEQLIDLDLLNNDFESAQRRVTEQLRLTTNAPAAVLLEAKVCSARKDWPCAEAALNKVIAAVPDAPAPYSMLANVHIATGNQPKALAQLRTAVERNPKNASAHLMMGVIYEAQKDYARARQAYENAIKASPTMTSARNNLAYLLSENLNQVDEALPHAAKAHELAPADPAIADTLGWIHYRRGEFSKALPLIVESAQKFPEQPEVQYHLAMARYTAGDEAAARAALNKVTQLDKALADSKGVSRKLAILDLNPASPSAIATLESALQEDKNDIIAALKLGQAYERTGANDKARASFERAAAMNPASPQPLLHLAMIHARLNDVPKALQAGRAARKLAPGDPTIAGVLGRVSFRAHDYPAALILLQDYARSDRADAEALYDLALASYGVGQFAEARANLDAYIKAGRGTRSADARNLATLMDFYSTKGDAGPAEAIATARLKQDPDDLPALVTLGLAAQRSGKHSEAAQRFEQVIALNKNYPVAQRQLAILYAGHLQNDQKAHEFGSKARQAFPNDSELAIALGKASYRRNDFQGAARLLAEGVQQRQSDPEAFFYLGMAYHKLGNGTDAKAQLNRAVSANLAPALASEARKVLASLK